MESLKQSIHDIICNSWHPENAEKIDSGNSNSEKGGKRGELEVESLWQQQSERASFEQFL
jgi:hypothetical protein